MRELKYLGTIVSIILNSPNGRSGSQGPAFFINLFAKIYWRVMVPVRAALGRTL